MSVYYQDESVTLYHGDCREVLPTLADRSVDCVITDPPYSEHTQANARSNNNNAPSGGRVLTGYRSTFGPIDDAALGEVLVQMGRLTRRWVITNLDHRHALALEESPPTGLRLMRLGVWIKTNPMPSLTADRPGMGWEMFACLHRDDTKPSWNGGGKCINHYGPTAQGMGHPTSKPLAMIRNWVGLFSDPGDTILDPFAGSGTTLRAAVDEGRKAIGIEVDESYCELIASRLAQGAFNFDMEATA